MLALRHLAWCWASAWRISKNLASNSRATSGLACRRLSALIEPIISATRVAKRVRRRTMSRTARSPAVLTASCICRCVSWASLRIRSSSAIAIPRVVLSFENLPTRGQGQERLTWLRPAVLRLEAGGELADHPVAVEHLRDRAVRLAPLADRGDELAVLQLDAIVGDRGAGEVDRLFLAGDEV